MENDDFSLFVDNDKKHVAYGVCVLGVAASGATFGSLAGGMTLPGAIGGAVMGLFLCKSVEEGLKRQLFGKNIKMSEPEFLNLVQQVKKQFPQLSKRQVLDLLAASRSAGTLNPNMVHC